MSSISWLQWFPAFESSQKGIIECHNLIMHFRVSLNVLSLLEILHSHYDLSLRLPSFSFFQLNFFCAALSQQSFLLLFSFPISWFSFYPPPTLSVLSLIQPLPFIPVLLQYFCSFLCPCSESLLLYFSYCMWTGGRAAGLLHPCVRDGNHRGDAVQCRATPPSGKHDGPSAYPLVAIDKF